MLPKSDEVEALHGRARRLTAELKKLQNKEVGKVELKTEASSIAREWLRLSPGLKESGVCRAERLDHFDSQMRELLSSAAGRTRASALSSKLSSLVSTAFDDVIVPLIQLEGSPRQVAARQVQAAFSSTLLPEEAVYIEEAARCVTVQAYRAAIIMLWAAAIARLHAAVVKRGFDAFNRAVDAIITKKGAPFNRIKEGAKIASLPELQRSRDADVIIVGMELFAYDLQVFQELDRLLGTRNDAAHPGMATPGALDVQQFATKINSLVFARVTA